MIPLSMREANKHPAGHGPDRQPTRPATWQTVLREAVRDPAELARLLDLPEAFVHGQVEAAADFALLVPRGYLARMRRGDPHDALLRQVLPALAETVATSGYVADPLEEARFADAGTVRKYSGRALLVTTGACPIHCRYCFRRHFPYAQQLAARAGWRAPLATIAADASIEEVILSGGDPLSLATSRLQALSVELEKIPHVKRLRIHTRFPIAIPERVDHELLHWLRSSRLATVVVIHANHPQELADTVVVEALRALRGVTTSLLNQSVLLSDVNDSPEILIELSRSLFECGVLPYYLHVLDRVAGTAHFDVDDETARALLAAMRAALPGYLVPRLVREVPGALSKTPLV
jgi:EF-P beta-lysylation protein EpmB